MPETVPATGGGSYTFTVPVGGDTNAAPKDLKTVAEKASQHLNRIDGNISAVKVKGCGSAPAVITNGAGTINTGLTGLTAALVDYQVPATWAPSGGPPQLHVASVTGGTITVRVVKADGTPYTGSLSSLQWVAW